jgi:imidazolonepropionase-like amidohydrolase
MARTIFRDANLLDGRSPARPHTTVVVDGERISAVASGEGPAAQDGDRVVDLRGKTLMPGMSSCHFHATFDGTTLDLFPLGIDKPPGYLMLRAANSVRTALHCGFTSVVGAGGGDDIDAQLKLAIEDGVIQGPRIMAGSRNLGTSSGYIDLENWWWELGNIGACRLADGPDEFRKVVRDEIKRGAEMIKLFVTGGHGNVNTATSEFSRDELAAVVRAAHERGKKVRAHCAWKPQILECIELGVDVIDHADEIDTECIQAMVEAGTFLDPSVLFLEKLLGVEEMRVPGTEALIAATESELENMLRRLPEANEAGVKIVLGDDYGTVLLPHGTYAEELEFYVKRIGIPPLDVIRWATLNGAELMSRVDELGTVEEGKLADLLVVDGDPSADIGILQDRGKLLAIMKGGELVKDALAG